MTFPAFHVPNILAFQMNEPCFHSISLGARYEPDRANLSSLRFPKFPPKKVLFGVCHRLCGYCLSTVYYTARTFACSSDLDSGHSHHRYVIASRHIQRTISYIFYDLGFVLPTSYKDILLHIFACRRLDCSFQPNMTGIIPNIGYSVVIFKSKSSHFVSEL